MAQHLHIANRVPRFQGVSHGWYWTYDKSIYSHMARRLPCNSCANFSESTRHGRPIRPIENLMTIPIWPTPRSNCWISLRLPYKPLSALSDYFLSIRSVSNCRNSKGRGYRIFSHCCKTGGAIVTTLKPILLRNGLLYRFMDSSQTYICVGYTGRGFALKSTKNLHRYSWLKITLALGGHENHYTGETGLDIRQAGGYKIRR